MTENSTRLFIFLIGALCGVVGSSLWNSEPSLPSTISTSTPTETSSASTSTPPLVEDMSGTIEVGNQKAGKSVLIDSVTVPPPGVWIAVHDVTADKLGNVLGAAHVRGPASAVKVPLLRSTIAGHSYAVVLYRDDGDDAFKLGNDSIYVDFDTGAPVIAPFEAN